MKFYFITYKDYIFGIEDEIFIGKKKICARAISFFLSKPDCFKYVKIHQIYLKTQKEKFSHFTKNNNVFLDKEHKIKLFYNKYFYVGTGNILTFYPEDKLT